jgi:hypothetical protein
MLCPKQHRLTKVQSLVKSNLDIVICKQAKLGYW